MVKPRRLPYPKTPAAQKPKIVPMSLTPDALADLDTVACDLHERGLVAQPFKNKPNRSGTIAYVMRERARRLKAKK